jgi:hypothetical protein
MARYVVFIHERETPNGVADIPADVMEAHGRLPGRVEESGGRILHAFATLPTTVSSSVRDGVVTDGPFIESKEAVAGFFVVEARDAQHAREIGMMVPIVDGGVEVRPLLAD